MATAKTASKRTHQVGTPATAAEDNLGEPEQTKFSILDRFRETIKTTTVDPEAEPYALEIPTREEVVLLFDLSKLDYETYQTWMRKAEDKKRKGEYNYFTLAVIVISNLNVGIRLNGAIVEKDGDEWTVASQELHSMLNVPIGNTRQAIRELFNSFDGHAIQMMRMVVEKAGYTLDGDVREADDPLDN